MNEYLELEKVNTSNSQPWADQQKYTKKLLTQSLTNFVSQTDSLTKIVTLWNCELCKIVNCKIV